MNIIDLVDKGKLIMEMKKLSKIKTNQNAIEKLLEYSTIKGYISFNDVLDVIDLFELSIMEVDSVCDHMTALGYLIKESDISTPKPNIKQSELNIRNKINNDKNNYKGTNKKIISVKNDVNLANNKKTYNRIEDVIIRGEQNLLVKLKEMLVELQNLEKNYRNIYNGAVDIEDINVSQKTKSGAYFKIRKLKELKNIVIDLNNSVIYDLPIESEKINKISVENEIKNELQNEIEMNNKVPNNSGNIDIAIQEHKSENHKKIGEYVRRKMFELSKSGITFSDAEIDIMQEKSWAKKNIGLEYEFIKVIYMNHISAEQRNKESQYEIYWKKVYNFGKYKILLSNKLTEMNRKMFDIWYDKLNKNDCTPEQNSQDNRKIIKNYQEGHTFKEPISIELFSEVYPIKYWNEVLIKVCEIMIIKKPYTFGRVDRDRTLNSDDRTNFSYVESEIKLNKKKLSNDLWIETNTSAADIVRECKKILELCGFSEKRLTINYK